MAFAQPQKFIARVSDKYFVSENERFLYVKFELIKPDRISFEAGQYMSFKIDQNGERRSYSIVSTPDDNHGFHILAEMVEGGRGSAYLGKLNPGDSVEVLGPLGRFSVAQLNSDQQPQAGTATQNKMLFVATGSGIVPIYSMINDLLINKHETRQMRLHWGMRSENDLFFVDNLARLGEIYPNFVYDIVLSRPSAAWSLCTGYVQDCLERDFPLGLGEWEAYVCGREDKVLAISDKLRELGVANDQIHHERFT